MIKQARQEVCQSCLDQGASGFPEGMDLMDVPGMSGQYIGDMFAKSLERHLCQTVESGQVEKQRS